MSPEPPVGERLAEPIIERLRLLRVVPVVEITESGHAARLAAALDDGGLPCAEITFRTPAAAEAIRIMRSERPDMLIGAGTILTVAQAKEAHVAGASFAVAPGFNSRVVDHCLDLGLPILPGVCTPTEVEAALERGLRTLKFFPAEPAGGIPFLNSLAGPYRMVAFVPTGGIGPSNLQAYLAVRNVVACGGSWITQQSWMSEGRFDLVRDEAARAVKLASASIS